MANILYDTGRAAFLNGGINWASDNIKVVAVDSADYTLNATTHAFLSDIAAGGRVATSGNLASKTTTAGVADADDVLLTAVTGDPFEAIVIYKDTGVAATSQLIAYIDTATGLPATPVGDNITIQWANTANRIFKL